MASSATTGGQIINNGGGRIDNVSSLEVLHNSFALSGKYLFGIDVHDYRRLGALVSISCFAGDNNACSAKEESRMHGRSSGCRHFGKLQHFSYR